MNSIAIRGIVGSLVVASATVSSAQSLAEIARQEEARRRTVTSPGKVYTNDALRPEPAPQATEPSSSAAPATSGAPAATPPAAAAPPSAPAAEAPEEAPKSEADWRKRVTAIREALSRAETFAEALQSRINVLSADFVNRDDPAQRNVVAADREKALAELNRVKLEIQQHQKALTAIQDEARRAGVPAGWVR
jgi:hypothetical protein